MMDKKEFLQSDAWARLQAAAGHEAVRIGNDAYGFVHVLPLVGRYLYTPRFPAASISNFPAYRTGRQFPISKLIEAAKKADCRWIRIEPMTEEVLEEIQNIVQNPSSVLPLERGGGMMVRAPPDMQPRETFVIDISKSEEELLAAMKSKTRYNIRLAEKKGVRVFATHERKYQEAFLDLITRTAERKEIVPHSRGYYEKFFTELPEEMCSLFVAEYESTVVAANLVMACGDTATYLHGGSGDQYREAMAPFLLQWEQIKFAKARGCSKYDFGGIRIHSKIQNPKSKIDSWEGITRFKTGFSPKTEPTVFPGCYDIVLDKRGYKLYAQLRFIQKAISSVKKLFRI